MIVSLSFIPNYIMALQLNQTNRGRNLRLAVGTGAVILGTSYLILNTFPHLKTSIYNYITNTKSDDEDIQDEEDNEPIELTRSTENLKNNQTISSSSSSSNISSTSSDKLSHTIPDESIVDISKWSDDNLKSWLNEVSILNFRFVFEYQYKFKFKYDYYFTFNLKKNYCKLTSNFEFILSFHLHHNDEHFRLSYTNIN